MTDKLFYKVVLIALIAQIGFILYMNLFRADTIIDYDSSSAYMHEMEMGSQGRIFPAEYGYQRSLDLDSGALVSALLYRFTGDIFLSRGITNILVVFLYIYVINTILANAGVSRTWKCFGMLLFLIPYSMIMLGYWRMLFAGGGFFALRALVPLLLISVVQDIDKGKELKKYAARAVLLLLFVFLAGMSSGAYILMCALCPLILWEFVNAFLKADCHELRSKRMILAVLALGTSVMGIVLRRALGLPAIADRKSLLTSDKWIDAMLSAFAGIFELFGGLTIHENVSLFSAEGIGTAVDFLVTLILLVAIPYTIVKCVKKKEISNMSGYILSLMLVNALMFCFVDLKYGETVYESRYHLVPMLPAFILLAMMLEDLSAGKSLKKIQTGTLQLMIMGLFAASLLYGDAQWVYAKTALGSGELKELNAVMEAEGIKTAFIVGDDNKVLGRKLRVYSRDVHYIVLSDGAASAWQTVFGGTSRYLDHSMQEGKTAVIASPEAYESLPDHLVRGMSYLKDYNGLQIHVSEQSRFDCVGGIVAEKDRVEDFPYSPGYAFENALIDEEGVLVMKAGGGDLYSSYAAAEGTWTYTVYYDMPEAEQPGRIEIMAGDERFCAQMDPSAASVSSGAIAMSDGETVSFSLKAPEGTRISRIEISRRE
ncbi:MAG: hypothetical protein K6E50_13220 [Lachnospiraceae bacterium]|nr:hypothetical protein [Lachnospiraceae bacterium]